MRPLGLAAISILAAMKLSTLYRGTIPPEATITEMVWVPDRYYPHHEIKWGLSVWPLISATWGRK